ncbi:MAG: hypothetical protein H6742_01300 [Alphaproteobacteria bacterium]|nr:hypothetical protein [Alphaproteobacteria bacterium]
MHRSIPLLLTVLAWLALVTGPAAAGTPREALAEGDAAWERADRGAAARAWREAAASQGDPAVVAMAELRLLRVSGGIGLAAHGPRADRALATCPTEDPWCALAWADRAAIVSELGLSDQRDDAREILDATAQWARDVGREDVRALAEARMAALARGPVPGPGTWTVGLGVLAAPGLGAGPLLRFVHPDVAWKAWRLELGGHATTAGSLRLAGGLTTRGRWWLTTGAAVERVPVPHYTIDGWRYAAPQVLGWRARAGAGLTAGPVSAWLGPQVRVDTPEGGLTVPGHGAFGGLSWAAAPAVQLRVSSELALFGPPHLGLRTELIGTRPVGRSVLAGRMLTDLTPLSTSPTWRQAAWGGGEVLRHAPLGRLRGPVLTGLVGEWRAPVVGPLGVVLLGEAALQVPDEPAALQLHAGGGGGLRLALPPRPHNTVRLDAAFGTLGWALTAGWGEAF